MSEDRIKQLEDRLNLLFDRHTNEINFEAVDNLHLALAMHTKQIRTITNNNINLLNGIYTMLRGSINLLKADGNADELADIQDTLEYIRDRVRELAENLGYELDKYIPLFGKKLAAGTSVKTSENNYTKGKPINGESVNSPSEGSDESTNSNTPSTIRCHSCIHYDICGIFTTFAKKINVYYEFNLFPSVKILPQICKRYMEAEK